MRVARVGRNKRSALRRIEADTPGNGYENQRARLLDLNLAEARVSAAQFKNIKRSRGLNLNA